MTELFAALAALLPLLLALLERWAAARQARRERDDETDRVLADGRAERVAARLSELFERAGRRAPR